MKDKRFLQIDWYDAAFARLESDVAPDMSIYALRALRRLSRRIPAAFYRNDALYILFEYRRRTFFHTRCDDEAAILIYLYNAALANMMTCYVRYFDDREYIR